MNDNTKKLFSGLLMLYTCVSIVQNMYSLRPILLFANTDVSSTKMCLDISILTKSTMGRGGGMNFVEKAHAR
jgi:hypothetical protein